MNESTADVQRDIALTRERMSETIAELDARISERVAVIKERLDLTQLVEDHPWPALAVAVGVGVLLAGTRADAKAAQATVRVAKGAPGATADLARRGWDAATSAVGHEGDDGNGREDDEEPGLGDRVRSTITRAIGVDELMSQMRDAAMALARPASYTGQNVPRNTGQEM
jgi:ElaB/YqjD/DUF883 family membrane-anchored ribosome-binding protein